MNYRYIGRTGLRVSPICLGTMTFATQCDKKEAFKIMDKAYEKGVNFFDTAEIYPIPASKELGGLTEEILGDWLKNRSRDKMIIATKVSGAASGWFVPPTREGMTAIDRHHITKAIEGSLRRLKTDYIDLYQMHWPDTIVPIEESMEAFDRLVQDGKVRYLGTSNDTAYGVTKANMTAQFKGYKRFESIQNNFSLLNRRFLDEMQIMCEREQVSLLPYSPLAGGVLSGKYNNKFMTEGRFRAYRTSDNPRMRVQADRFLNDKTIASTKEYIRLAQKIDISPVTLAIAWSKQFSFVASTIIGATKVEQLDESLKAMDLELSEEILKACDEIHEKNIYPMG